VNNIDPYATNLLQSVPTSAIIAIETPIPVLIALTHLIYHFIKNKF
jgi:hypothetical protein